MKNIVNKYINETRQYVVECLINEYSLDEINAISMVRKSSFNVLLNDNPEYVMHFNVEYWAEKIKNENDRLLAYAMA